MDVCSLPITVFFYSKKCVVLKEIYNHAEIHSKGIYHSDFRINYKSKPFITNYMENWKTTSLRYRKHNMLIILKN